MVPQWDEENRLWWLVACADWMEKKTYFLFLFFFFFPIFTSFLLLFFFYNFNYPFNYIGGGGMWIGEVN